MIWNHEDRPLLAGRYELTERAGEGGMATVFRATMHGAAGFRRQVAVKRLLSSLIHNEEFIAMFVEEARVGSLLQHPNIVQILDFAEDDEGRYFLVMEWVEGLDLCSWLEAFERRGALTSWPLVSAIGIEALRGLQAAHTRLNDAGNPAPVIHRDVAPQNIMIGTNGVVKLSDFGLSRAADRSRITNPDIVKGKLSYLAPELSHGVDASPQSDLFGVGVVLWEALAGRKLYQGQNDIEVFLAAREADIPNLRELRPDVPDALARTVHRALAHDPSQRFSSAHHMARALASICRQHTGTTDATVLARSVRDARLTLSGGSGAGPAPPPPPSAATSGEVPIPLTKRKKTRS